MAKNTMKKNKEEKKKKKKKKKKTTNQTNKNYLTIISFSIYTK